MTKIVPKELYCSKCKKTFIQPVYYSVSSFMMSEEEKKKLKEGTLFRNFCPQCGSELISDNKDKK